MVKVRFCELYKLDDDSEMINHLWLLDVTLTKILLMGNQRFCFEKGQNLRWLNTGSLGGQRYYPTWRGSEIKANMWPSRQQIYLKRNSRQLVKYNLEFWVFPKRVSLRPAHAQYVQKLWALRYVKKLNFLEIQFIRNW